MEGTNINRIDLWPPIIILFAYPLFMSAPKYLLVKRVNFVSCNGKKLPINILSMRFFHAFSLFLRIYVSLSQAPSSLLKTLSINLWEGR